MKTKLIILFVLLGHLSGVPQAAAQATAFTYQGQLQNSGAAANGRYDFQFSLFNAPGDGSQIGATATNLAVSVTNGVFTTPLDFGAVFTGSPAWLAIGVRSNGLGAYVGLTPLQPLTPTPNAIFANTASNLLGTIQASQLSPALVTNFQAGVTLSNASVQGGVAIEGGMTNTGNLNISGNLNVASNIDDFGNINLWNFGATLSLYGSNGGMFLAVATELAGDTRPTIYSQFSSNILQIGNTFGGPKNGSGYDVNEVRIMATNAVFDQSIIVGNDAFFNGYVDIEPAMHLNSFLYNGEYIIGLNSYFSDSIVQIGGLPSGGAISSEIDLRGTNTVIEGSVLASGTVTAHGVLLTSDRNTKENFAALDSQSVLAKVAALPLTEWNYKADAAGVRHVGPMAQDFQAAFQLNGSDDKHISVVDESGVALAAIQGLNQKLNEKDREIENLKAQAAKVDSLEKRLTELEQRVQSLAEKK